jgi:hypothetical protein
MRGNPDATNVYREDYPPVPVLKVEMSLGQIREMGKTLRKGEFTSIQAEAFITLYKRDLDELLTQVVREFITKKIGK